MRNEMLTRWAAKNPRIKLTFKAVPYRSPDFEFNGCVIRLNGDGSNDTIQLDMREYEARSKAKSLNNKL